MCILKKKLLLLVCLLCLGLSACNLPAGALVFPQTAQANPSVNMYMLVPLNGEIIPEGSTQFLRAYIRIVLPPPSPITIEQASFIVNGMPVGSSNSEFFPLSFDWIAPAPGVYYIQAKATLSDATTVVSEPARICVMTLNTLPTWYGGYFGPCPLATQVPNSPETGVLALNAVAAPKYVDFSRVCAPNPSVTMIVNVDDPQDQVALVSVNFLRPNLAFGQYLNWITTRPNNQKEYRTTIHFQPEFWEGTERIEWQVFALSRTGLAIQTTRDVIVVRQLECSQHPLEIANGTQTPTPTDIQPLEIIPSQTPTQILTATATATPLGPPKLTFTKNAFCRKGPDQSFSDVTAILSGETVDILNVSQDGFWYYIYWAKFKAKCWVAAKTGQASGDAAGLTVLVGPALPKPNNPVDPSKPPEPASPVDPTSPPAPCNPLVRTCP